MIFDFGKKSGTDDPVEIEVAAIDGPSQPLDIHPPPPGTKRLSKKGQFLLLVLHRFHCEFLLAAGKSSFSKLSRAV